MSAGDVTMTDDGIPVDRMSLDDAMELAARIADPEDGCVEEMMEFGADVCDVLRCEVLRLRAIVGGDRG